jgi:hypothetical protein|tara:strand:+ start:295 stop:504 length:210 start_codon:yes stop_codon:yes gene_type:complete
VIFKKSIKTQIEEAEEEIENCKEAKMLLDSAIKSTFLFDSHSLICQKWIKEYDHRIDYLNNFLEGAYNE